MDEELKAIGVRMCHTSKAVCLNSATAALELNLRVLGIGPGDEVRKIAVDVVHVNKYVRLEQ